MRKRRDRTVVPLFKVRTGHGRPQQVSVYPGGFIVNGMTGSVLKCGQGMPLVLGYEAIPGTGSDILVSKVIYESEPVLEIILNSSNKREAHRP